MRKTINIIIFFLLLCLPINVHAQGWNLCYCEDYNIGYALPNNFIEEKKNAPFVQYYARSPEGDFMTWIQVIDIRGNGKQMDKIYPLTFDEDNYLAKSIILNIFKTFQRNGYTGLKMDFHEAAGKKCIAIYGFNEFQGVPTVQLTFIFFKDYSYIAYNYTYPVDVIEKYGDIISYSLDTVFF